MDGIILIVVEQETDQTAYFASCSAKRRDLKVLNKALLNTNQ